MGVVILIITLIYAIMKKLQLVICVLELKIYEKEKNKDCCNYCNHNNFFILYI